jgi:hypothetical protein
MGQSAIPTTSRRAIAPCQGARALVTPDPKFGPLLSAASPPRVPAVPQTGRQRRCGWLNDRSSDRNEQHHATLQHHPANAACPRHAIRSGTCMHLLIAGSPLPRCKVVTRGRSDQDQAVPMPSDVKSRQDTTGRNENKPAGPEQVTRATTAGPPVRLGEVGLHLPI